jgi:streptogramin lyase
MALAMLAGLPSFGQRKATIENVREIPFTSAPNLLKLPSGEYLGEAVAVATNSKGHIFVFHRSANTRLFEFDQAGNYLKEIGSGYYGFEFAHSVRVDKDDNIWAVDEGTNMITKFSPDGKVLMVPGRPEPTGAEVYFLPADGCRLGPARQYFRFRWLLQQSGREI